MRSLKVVLLAAVFAAAIAGSANAATYSATPWQKAFWTDGADPDRYAPSYNNSNLISVDGSPDRDAYLVFQIEDDANGHVPVTAATLKLDSTSTCPGALRAEVDGTQHGISPTYNDMASTTNWDPQPYASQTPYGETLAAPASGVNNYSLSSNFIGALNAAADESFFTFLRLPENEYDGASKVTIKLSQTHTTQCSFNNNNSTQNVPELTITQ